MSTRVLSVNSSEWTLLNPNAKYYIGRGAGGSIPSDPRKYGGLGNPHPVGKWCTICRTTHQRGEAVKAYERTFADRIETDPLFRETVLSLKGKALGCFCAPSACHGDVIKRWLETQP